MNFGHGIVNIKNNDIPTKTREKFREKITLSKKVVIREVDGK